MAPTPEKLPQFREVNHRINIINFDARHVERRPTCPQALEGQLHKKLARYECAGWWVQRLVPHACLLLCIAKKDGSLRTIIDACQCNSNTILDVTPMPNMQAIMDNMARKTYCSKIDMTDAYEQIHIEPECIKFSGFSTPYGTFESNVMQQGDCNAPSTFQRVLTWVF